MERERLRNVDAVAAVPPAAITLEFADDEFTSLNRVAEGCDHPPPAASIAPSDTRFLVVVYPPDDPQAAKNGQKPMRLEDLTAIAHPVTVIRHYAPLPIIEIETTTEGAAAVAALPQVGAVLPALGNVEKARAFAAGLAALTRIAASQREMLPQAAFGGIEVDAETPYPILVKDDNQWFLDNDPSKTWPAAPAVVPVINMSVGPTSATFPQLPNDLVNLATFGASAETLVVVAAGNCGTLGMSPWATPDWVLGVGATEDEEGTTLADYSSRGPGDGSSPGPDLVAWGADTYGGMDPGTSFAAPRVSAHALVCTAAFLQLGREVRLIQGERPQGVSLVGMGFVDEYGAGIWNFARKGELHMPPALPIVGVRPGAAADLVALTAESGTPLDLTVRPALVRESLLSAATPMPGYGPHEVGAGFLDDARMIAWLANVSGLDIARWFCPNGFAPQSLDHQTEDQLADVQVFDEGDLALLAQVVLSTGPVLFYDWRKQRSAFAPFPSEAIDALDLDLRINGFEVT
jgi:hypothetical protein